MARWSKWVPKAVASQPTTVVARRVLRDRFRTVLSNLAAAARHGLDDPETVHQLRVSTRRGIAALDAFADVLPRRRAKKVARLLRQLRKAAGEARNLDVLGQPLLQALPNETLKKQIAAVIAASRKKAQEPIVEANAVGQRGKLRHQVVGLLRRIRWRPKRVKRLAVRAHEAVHFLHQQGSAAQPLEAVPAGTPPEPVPVTEGAASHPQKEWTYRKFARRRLQTAWKSFIELPLSPGIDAEALHAFRIQAKNVRYLLEMFARPLGRPLVREAYPLISEVQDRLGEINDHACALALIAEWSKAHPECQGLTALHAVHATSLADKRAQFLHAWPELRDQWMAACNKSLLPRVNRADGADPG